MSQPPWAVFAARLRALLKDGEIGDIAKAAGLRRETLSRWLSWDEESAAEHPNPTLESLYGLARALRTDIPTLVSDDPEREEAAAGLQELRDANREMAEERQRLYVFVQDFMRRATELAPSGAAATGVPAAGPARQRLSERVFGERDEGHAPEPPSDHRRKKR